MEISYTHKNDHTRTTNHLCLCDHFMEINLNIESNIVDAAETEREVTTTKGFVNCSGFLVQERCLYRQAARVCM